MRARRGRRREEEKPCARRRAWLWMSTRTRGTRGSRSSIGSCRTRGRWSGATNANARGIGADSRSASAHEPPARATRLPEKAPAKWFRSHANPPRPKRDVESRSPPRRTPRTLTEIHRVSVRRRLTLVILARDVADARASSPGVARGALVIGETSVAGDPGLSRFQTHRRRVPVTLGRWPRLDTSRAPRTVTRRRGPSGAFTRSGEHVVRVFSGRLARRPLASFEKGTANVSRVDEGADRRRP